MDVAIPVPRTPIVSAARARYAAGRNGDIVQLEDADSQTTVSIVPSVGNIAFEMKVKGHNILRWPFASLDEFKARPVMSGIPFVGPWANRLDEQAFYANGTRYPFDMELGNVRGAIPIHGFLTTTTEWRVVEVKADATSAWVTSRLEFFRQPAWMKQWPFAHTIDLTYRLQNGVLEVHTTIANSSTEPMPVAIGFHPYFQLTDSKRNDWTLSVAARTHWKLAANKIPTGETEPIEQLFDKPPAALRDYNLDDVFGDLIRDERGRATMAIAGKTQRLEVVFGPNYRAVVIWAPNPSDTGRGSQRLSGPPRPLEQTEFVCVEPMAGITDALNLAHKGLYKELQQIAPGGRWQESFWIHASGF
ncbi:MAG TPA: aldose 1-epimerase [Vicinamibacterales bacterium]|jgi:aldose 1-epimerase|nr:aldose 1-epimerase [Vicinamibacterales bacterium]